MSDVNFDKYLCYLSLKALNKYNFIPLEKGRVTELLVFLRKRTISNMLAFYLVNVYLTQKGTVLIMIEVVLHPNWPFVVTFRKKKQKRHGLMEVSRGYMSLG